MKRSRRLLESEIGSGKSVEGGVPTFGSCEFNVALINRMEPMEDRPDLKLEPTFGHDRLAPKSRAFSLFFVIFVTYFFLLSFFIFFFSVSFFVFQFSHYFFVFIQYSLRPAKSLVVLLKLILRTVDKGRFQAVIGKEDAFEYYY